MFRLGRIMDFKVKNDVSETRSPVQRYQEIRGPSLQLKLARLQVPRYELQIARKLPEIVPNQQA